MNSLKGSLNLTLEGPGKSWNLRCQNVYYEPCFKLSSQDNYLAQMDKIPVLPTSMDFNKRPSFNHVMLCMSSAIAP